jgi:SAM-dependent methyltransferase
MPRFIVDLIRFKKTYTGRIELFPCLHDWYEQGGDTRSDYFRQDLYVARKIYAAKPSKHVDIGSRIDGFVAHVASFREIEVFDIRPVTASVPGIVFRQADLMNPPESFIEYCDSLSCLHALEHFGLGRYGDPINPRGCEIALANMARLLMSGGIFYLSVPVGNERVEFNSHRVFDPNTVVRLAANNCLTLQRCLVLWEDFEFIELSTIEGRCNWTNTSSDGLGLFIFQKAMPRP